MRPTSHAWRAITFILLLLVLGFVPWSISTAFDPLRPADLVETPRAYQPTEDALATREAEQEQAATSSFTILPTEQAVAFAPTATLTPLASPVAVPDLIIGSVVADMPLFSCPAAAQQTEKLWLVGHPFAVLGWNSDLEGRIYLLIEDDPAQPQVWLQLGEGVVLSYADYRLVYGPAAACRPWAGGPSPTPTPTASLPPEDALSPTPTIPLPAIRTATPEPPTPIRLELDDAEATRQLAEEIPDIKHPAVHFTPDELEISGEVEIATPIGGIDGALEIRGGLELVEGKLYFHTTSLRARGRDYTDKDEADSVEHLMNVWLAQLLVRRTAQSFELHDGLLVVEAMEYHESILPTPRPTTTPTAGASPEVASPTPTNAAVEPSPMLDPAGVPTAIPLPAAYSISVTHLPGGGRAITSQQATYSSRAELLALTDPSVEFSPAGVIVSGQFTLPVALPGQPAYGAVLLTGGLGVQNGQLHFTVQDVSFEGQALGLPGVRQTLESAVNTWLPSLQAGAAITDFMLGDGTITLFP